MASLLVMSLATAAIGLLPVHASIGLVAPMVTGFALVAAGSLAFSTFFVFLPNHLVATSDRSPSSRSQA